MKARHGMGRLVLLYFGLASAIQAQPTPRQPAIQHQSLSSPSLRIVECEGKVCSPGGPGSPVWTFSGLDGVGQFASGKEQLRIEHLDIDSIAVRRRDVQGLTALYMGKIEGQRIIGSVIYYDVGHPNSSRTDAWNGTMEGSGAEIQKTLASSRLPIPSLPLTLKECEGNQCANPGTQYKIIWTFSGRIGRGWVGDSERQVVLEHLDAGLIIVRRLDGDALGGLTALYMGKIEGKRITGSVLYYDKAHPTIPRTDTWFGEIQDASGGPTYVARDAPGGSAGSGANPAVRNPDKLPSTSPAPSPSTAGYPPPPAGVPSTIYGRHQTFTLDLNGQWEGYYASPGIPTAIQIRHKGNHIEAELLHDDLTATGTTFLQGEFQPGTSIAQVKVLDMNGLSAFTGVPSGNYHADTFGTVDVDHVAIAHHQPFQRISLPSYNDVPCSSANEKAVGAEWAYMRAVVAQKAKDMPTAVCWLYVASIQKDATAQLFLAYCLHDGVGTKPDSAQALQWAMKSAENGNERGAYMLATLYERGDGVAADPQKALYWKNRAHDLEVEKKKQAEAEKQNDQQKQAEIEKYAVITALGAALFIGDSQPDPLCDSANDTDAQSAAKQRELRQKGLQCGVYTGHTIPIPIN